MTTDLKDYNQLNLISGEKNCVCTPLLCIEEKIDYNGNNLKYYASATLTKEECSCDCYSKPVCQGWSFMGKYQRT